MSIQADFSAALFDKNKSIPKTIECHDNDRVERRFAVYRNNVISSLIEALQAGFVVVEKAVGEEFFHHLARDFVLQSPPRSPRLMDFGSDFPQFIESSSATAGVPYLGDIARMEVLKRRVYFAADDEALSIADANKINEESVLGSRLKLVAAHALLTSKFPIYDIWQKLNGEFDGKIGTKAQDVLFFREGGDVLIQPLPAHSSEFFEHLEADKTLEEAALHHAENWPEAPIGDLVSRAIRITCCIIASDKA